MTTKLRRTASKQRAALGFAACLVALPITVTRSEETGMAEMRAADREAALAATAKDLAAVRLHLQRALNCLEGPQGEDFRSAGQDPCSGGAGAERDLPAGSVNRVRTYKAIRLGSVGITFHDFEPAHYTARAMQAVLDEGTR